MMTASACGFARLPPVRDERAVDVCHEDAPLQVQHPHPDSAGSVADVYPDPGVPFG